jgi:cytochrome P450
MLTVKANQATDAKHRITDEEMRDQSVTFLFAGAETT